MGNKIVFFSFLIVLFLLFFQHSFAQTCGNGSCEQGENACTCQDDCGSCEGPVPGQLCKEYFCREDNQCTVGTIANCCGNEICELEENYGDCPADCIPKNVDIEVLSPSEQKFARGEKILLKIKVTADNRAVSSPTLSTTGWLEDLEFFNDGKHEDETAGDNIFATTFFIQKEMEKGIKTIEIKAEFLGISSTKQIEVEIDPTLEIQPEIKEEIELTQLLEISGKILKKEKASQSGFEVKVFADQQEIHSKTGTTDENGVFKTSYHSSLLDRVGSWRVTISAFDEFGNTSFFERTVSVKKPEKIEPLNIEVTKSFKEAYKQGESIDFVIQLVNSNQELVRGAEAFLVISNDEKMTLVEIEPGKYARSIEISREFKSGFNSFEIQASAIVNNAQANATQQIVAKIEGLNLQIEILEPSNLSYEVGEKIELKIKVTDFKGEAVNDAKVKALVKGKEVFLELTKIGTYSAVYEVRPEDEGEIKIDFSAQDPFENQGLKNISVGIGGKAFFYDISRHILVFGAITILILVAGTAGLIFIRSKKTVEGLEKKIAELEDKQKQTQQNYFHEHSISKKEYQQIMEKHEKEIKKVRNELAQLKQSK